MPTHFSQAKNELHETLVTLRERGYWFAITERRSDPRGKTNWITVLERYEAFTDLYEKKTHKKKKLNFVPLRYREELKIGGVENLTLTGEQILTFVDKFEKGDVERTRLSIRGSNENTHYGYVDLAAKDFIDIALDRTHDRFSFFLFFYFFERRTERTKNIFFTRTFSHRVEETKKREKRTAI